MIDLDEIVPRPDAAQNARQPAWWHPDQTRHCAIVARLVGPSFTHKVSHTNTREVQTTRCGHCGKQIWGNQWGQPPSHA